MTELVQVKAENVDWDQWLQNVYTHEQEVFRCGPVGFVEELCGLTTYDGSIARLIIDDFLAVVKAIIEKTTMDWLSDPAKYKTFITMVNLPRIADYLTWGTSIRFPWFEDGVEMDPFGAMFAENHKAHSPAYVILDREEIERYWMAVIRYWEANKNHED